MGQPVYMDNHASTPVDSRVVDQMLPYFSERCGNPASRSHRYGWEADEAVEKARRQVAGLLGARAKEIIFTNGATESNNLVIQGLREFHGRDDCHVVTVVTEHKSVLDSCRALERSGVRVTYLPVASDGVLDPDDLRRSLTDSTALISVMYANNEIGTIQPLAEIGAIAKERGILFHTDATQGVGRCPLDVGTMGIDLLSLSAHKLYGPKGCGALYVRSRDPRVRLSPMMHGGGHERGIRPGTLNVPGIVGLGAACEIAAAEMVDEQARILALRERLFAGLVGQVDRVDLNGHATRRLAGNLNLRFAFVEADSLLMALEEIALSSGSACTSATLESSHVLKAIGLNEDEAHSSVRFGLGRFNTEDEVDYVVERVAEEVRRQRDTSVGYEMAGRVSHAGL